MDDRVERFLRGSHVYARLVEQVLERGYLEEAVRDRLTFDQLNLIKFLARPGRYLVKDVSRFLNASTAAASKAVSRLKARGLVATTRSQADRRAEMIEVTAEGRAAIRRYERLKEDRLAGLLRGEDLDALSAALEKGISILMREREVAGNPCLGCGVYYSSRCIVKAAGQHCPCR